jgi:8-oxo-dGTP pyrophosphatase MutT (NUDIX family)
MYDMFVGGVVGSGESYAAAARREVGEELGIEGPIPEYLFTHLYLGSLNRSWIQVYRTVWDGPIRHQPEEIVWGEWMSASEVLPMTGVEPFVPDGLEVYHRYLEWLGHPEKFTREEIP